MRTFLSMQQHYERQLNTVNTGLYASRLHLVCEIADRYFRETKLTQKRCIQPQQTKKLTRILENCTVALRKIGHCLLWLLTRRRPWFIKLTSQKQRSHALPGENCPIHKGKSPQPTKHVTSLEVKMIQPSVAMSVISVISQETQHRCIARRNKSRRLNRPTRLTEWRLPPQEVKVRSTPLYHVSLGTTKPLTVEAMLNGNSTKMEVNTCRHFAHQ